MHDNHCAHMQAAIRWRRTWSRAFSMMLLVLALGIGALSSVLAVPAYAADGSITVVGEDQAQETGFDAYLIFDAEVTEGGEATHVTWADEVTKEVMLALLDEQGYVEWLEANHPDPSQHDRAQNAEAYLSELLENPSNSEASPNMKGSPNVRAAQIARGVTSSEMVASHTFAAGETSICPQGLWLLVSTEQDGEGALTAGTAPLWVAVGSAPVTINQKAGRPTISKLVRTEEQVWSTAANAQIGEDVDFALTAALPSNFASFDHYHLRFEDSFDTALEIGGADEKDPASLLRIHVDDHPVAIDDSHVRAQIGSDGLTVDFPDLKDSWWNETGISAGSLIRIEYQAHLTPSATSRAEGNLNTARLVYTSDPVRLGESVTEEVVARVLTQALSLVKHSQNDKTPLPGAGFTIMPKTSSGTDTVARYVQGDGSLAQTQYVFTTGKNGKITLKGLKTGTYIVSEIEAPKGYQKLAESFELVVESEFDQLDQDRSSLTASSSSPEATITKIDADEGLIELSVADVPLDATPSSSPTPAATATEKLAQTGGGPIAIVSLVLGLALVFGSGLPKKPS